MASMGNMPEQVSRFSSHYQRLQTIEQKIVRGIQLAGQVMEVLSHAAQADRQLLTQLSEEFLQQIKEAQQLVLEAVKESTAERSFEANVYHSMIQNIVSSEKLDAVVCHLSGIRTLLQQYKQANALAEAVEHGDVLMLDIDGPADAAVAAQQVQAPADMVLGPLEPQEQQETGANENG